MGRLLAGAACRGCAAVDTVRPAADRGHDGVRESKWSMGEGGGRMCDKETAGTSQRCSLMPLRCRWWCSMVPAEYVDPRLCPDDFRLYANRASKALEARLPHGMSAVVNNVVKLNPGATKDRMMVSILCGW